MALVKRIAYNKSFNLHRVFSIVYLGLVFHAIILVKTTYWLQPIGMITALLMVGGTISAVISLVGAIGKSNKHAVTVKNISHFNHSDVLKIDVSIEDKWPGHRAGQFAFVQFTDTKESHPFTISSTWQDDGELSFIIKALGDHTSSIINTVEVGQSLTVEGPYGQFDFESQHNQQVWVAGGIGITPFIARMKYLSLTKEFSQPVTLFYCVKSSDSKMIEYVKSCATAANVHLEVLVEDNNQRLDLETIKSHVSDWQSSDYWFCGPTQFGKTLKSSLTNAGVDRKALHQELFEMR
jgi:predicted ferric reductase